MLQFDARVGILMVAGGIGALLQQGLQKAGAPAPVTFTGAGVGFAAILAAAAWVGKEESPERYRRSRSH